MNPESGPSDEERAEAEKFNKLVDEGTISRAEAGQIEKDKTPEEVETEKNLERGKAIAMSKIDYWREKSIYFHGTEMANIEGLIRYGPDFEKHVETPFYHPGQFFFFHRPHWTNWFRYPVNIILDEQFEWHEHKVDPHSDLSDAYYIEGKLNPEFLRGVIIDRREFTGRSSRVPISDVIHLMEEIAKQEPERALPVYDEENNLWWPYYLNSQAIEEKVRKSWRTRRKSKEQTEDLSSVALDFLNGWGHSERAKMVGDAKLDPLRALLEQLEENEESLGGLEKKLGMTQAQINISTELKKQNWQLRRILRSFGYPYDSVRELNLDMIDSAETTGDIKRDLMNFILATRLDRTLKYDVEIVRKANPEEILEIIGQIGQLLTIYEIQAKNSKDKDYWERTKKWFNKICDRQKLEEEK